MISLVAIIGLGFLLGMRHASDPDHVIAVTTIVSRERDIKQAAAIGIAWGAGHTLTIVAVGSAMVLFRVVLSARMGLAMELAVAVMLIALGLRNMGALFGFTAKPYAASVAAAEGPVAHDHGGFVHTHRERMPLRLLDRCFGRVTFYQVLRPLVVGIVHGLAGSAAIALLVLGTIQSFRWAVLYLLVFGIGTILGMMLITMTVASTFSFGQKRFASIGRHFGVASGIISLVFGLFIAYQIGFVNGLFTTHATWIPR